MNLTEKIVTCFGIGKIEYAPGTFGSLAAYPLALLIFFISIMIAIFIPIFKNIYFIYVFSVLVLSALFIVGCRHSKIYIDKYNKEDPSEIVIDEVIGQALLLLIILPLNIDIFYSKNTMPIVFYFIILPFILFRLFDIIKPWPISWFDKNIKGGFGVMLDDVIASIFAAIVYYNIFFLIYDK